MTQLIYAAAPDGSTISTDADAVRSRRDDDTCPAVWGPEGTVRAWCTEAAGHPGPWHIASTGKTIVKVWPADVPQEQDQETRT